MLASGRWFVLGLTLVGLPAMGCTTQTSLAPPAAAPSPWPGVSLPFAQNGLPMNDAPVVVVDGHHATLDGEVVGDLDAIAALGRMRRVDPLFTRLKEKRKAWRAAHPGEPFSGELNLVVDVGVRAFLVKSVFQTAAFAGYPNASFVVRGAGGLQRLQIDAQVPALNGSLAPETIQRIIRQNYGKLRECYEQALARDTHAGGRVSTRFVIGRDGHVTEATPVDAADASTPELHDKLAVACIVRGFASLVFPPPEGGIVTVVYPINFNAAE